MADSKYKITKGLAHLITTGEPVFVTGFETLSGTEFAKIIRPVVTQNGIEHREESVSTDQLETRHKQAKRNIEFDQFVQSLREEADSKRYMLSRSMKQELMDLAKSNPQATNPSHSFSGNGDING